MSERHTSQKRLRRQRRARALGRAWADLPLRAKGLVVVTIPLLALVASGVLFSAALTQDRQAQAAVLHSVEVERQVAQLRVLVQAGVGGYLLTGREVYLRNYEEATRNLPAALDRLAELVRDDPGQAERLLRLRALADRRFEMQAALVASVRADSPPQRRLELLERSREVSDALLAQFNAMQGQEQRLLAMRQDHAGRTRALMLGATGLSMLLGLAGGIAAMLLFTSGVTRRARHLEQNAERLAEGLPLLAPLPGDDELGSLGRRLEGAAVLLHDREERRRQASETVREREATLQAVFDASPDIISILDGDGRVRFASGALEWITGLPPDSRIGRDALESELIHPHDRDGFAEAQRRVLSGESGEAVVRLRTRHSNGRWVVLEAHTRPLGDDGAVIVSRDVTRQAALEEDLRQAKLAAEEANQAKSEYLSRMSHELRTPLNAILGFAQLLEMDQLAQEQHDSVRHILSGARHLLALINEVLDIAAIEAGRLPLSLEPVAVSHIAAEAVDLIRPLAGQHAVLLVDGAQTCHEHVLGDRQRLKQVLLNLLSNAVKYNREGGSVRLACEPVEDGRLRLSVTDTGPGIAPEPLELLFMPFERLGSEQTAVEGSGLGLSLSKRLAEAMGGTLGVSTAVGRGSTFWVELPLTDGPLEQAERQQVESDDGEALPRTAGPALTVLCIEDNLSNLQLVERVLERRPAVRLISAMRPQLGLELAAEYRPDLVLLDLHLPDMPGAEVLRRLRADPATAAVPVVVLTADARPGLAARLVEQGARALLTKPLDVRELLDVLDGIAEERQRAGSPASSS